MSFAQDVEISEEDILGRNSYPMDPEDREPDEFEEQNMYSDQPDPAVKKYKDSVSRNFSHKQIIRTTTHTLTLYQAVILIHDSKLFDFVNSCKPNPLQAFQYLNSKFQFPRSLHIKDHKDKAVKFTSDLIQARERRTGWRYEEQWLDIMAAILEAS